MKNIILKFGSLLGLLLLTTLLGACGDANEEGIIEEEKSKVPGILPVENKEEDDLGLLHY
jgi:hypothetical protein